MDDLAGADVAEADLAFLPARRATGGLVKQASYQLLLLFTAWRAVNVMSAVIVIRALRRVLASATHGRQAPKVAL